MTTRIREGDHGVYGSGSLGFGSKHVELQHDVALPRNCDRHAAELSM